MTLDELIRELQALKEEKGVPGGTPVVWESLEHTYPVELRVTTRIGLPVILVNA